MKSVITNATFNIFNQETGESVLEVKTPVNTMTIESKPTKEELVLFKIKFDDCEEIQTFITKETYIIMQDYKNKTQKTKDSAMPKLQSINKDDLMPFTMKFDDGMDIQVFITRETYQVMMDYKNRTQ